MEKEYDFSKMKEVTSPFKGKKGIGINLSHKAIYDTERLYVRDFKPDDLDEFHKLAQNPDIYKYMPWGPNSEEDTRNFIQMSIEQGSKESRRFFDVPIILKETHLIVGCIGMRVSSFLHKKADMGYWIKKELWGQGFATEATLGILNFGFQKLKMNKIYATADPENPASIRVLEKIGMKKEGYLKEDMCIRGEYRNSVLMAILKKEFKP